MSQFRPTELHIQLEQIVAKQAERKIKRVLRITVRQLVDEQIVAHPQGRHHRFRRDVERLKEKRPHHESDQQRLYDDLDGFPAAVF